MITRDQLINTKNTTLEDIKNSIKTDSDIGQLKQSPDFWTIRIMAISRRFAISILQINSWQPQVIVYAKYTLKLTPQYYVEIECHSVSG